MHSRSTPANGSWSDEAVITPSVEVVVNSSHTVTVLWLLYLSDGVTLVGSGNASADATITGGATLTGSITILDAELWSVSASILFMYRTWELTLLAFLWF